MLDLKAGNLLGKKKKKVGKRSVRRIKRAQVVSKEKNNLKKYI